MRVVALLLMWAVAAHGEAPQVPEAVSILEQGYGWRFVDSDGMSLYVYDGDETPGASSCKGPCAMAWPPLVASSGAPPVGEWSAIDRGDGTGQWAFRSRPVYRSAADTHPGAQYGDEANDVWHVAIATIPLAPGTRIATTLAGRVLADQRGMTLYNRDGDCVSRCLKTWSPAVAGALARPVGEWSIVERTDGRRQWVFRGRALYTFAGDVIPGDTRGHDRDQAWRAAVLEPPLPFPSWITEQVTDAGKLLADANGMTLYTFNAAGNRNIDQKNGFVVTCDDACFEKYWRPVIAEAESAPIGHWTVIAGRGGVRQWAYKGLPLYTNALDSRKGDLNGTRIWSIRAFRTVTRSGKPIAKL